EIHNLPSVECRVPAAVHRVFRNQARQGPGTAPRAVCTLTRADAIASFRVRPSIDTKGGITMRIVVCVVAILILTPIVCWPAHDIMLGIKAGVNIANFTGNDVFHNSSNTGAVGGAFARYGLSRSWSLQPEVLYTMRGAKFSVDDIQSEQQSNYLEIPLLA